VSNPDIIELPLGSDKVYNATIAGDWTGATIEAWADDPAVAAAVEAAWIDDAAGEWTLRVHRGLPVGEHAFRLRFVIGDESTDEFHTTSYPLWLVIR
jgi:hypothetical protein